MARPSDLSNALRLVVAGAGVFGLTCALMLARRGATVTVCDPAALGDNASGVAAGMLAPAFEALLDPLSRDHFQLLSAGRRRWPPFATSLSLPLERDGALWAGPDLAGVESRLGAIGARGVRIDPAEAAAAVSGLWARDGAVFTPEDWRIDVANGLLALRAAAQSAGVRFASQAVKAFESGSVRLADGERLAADRLVIAVGAARTDLAPELAQLSPIKGHILRMGGGPRSGPVVRGDGVYVRPHPTGAIVGASMEAGRGDREVDPRIAQDLADRAAGLFPSLSGGAYHISVGVRATTADGLPMVGRSTAPGVLLATGARRNGWLLAPSVGDVIAALAFDDDPGALAAAFSPTRG